MLRAYRADATGVDLEIGTDGVPLSLITQGSRRLQPAGALVLFG